MLIWVKSEQDENIFSDEVDDNKTEMKKLSN